MEVMQQIGSNSLGLVTTGKNDEIEISGQRRFRERPISCIQQPGARPARAPPAEI